MSHEGNDEIRERIAEDIQEMPHREKVMTLLGFFYDSGLWITADVDELVPTHPTKFHRSHGDDTSRRFDAQERLDSMDSLLIEVICTQEELKENG
jgi:hypothetical protein